MIEVGRRLRFCDYFVIAGGETRPHVRAMADEIHARTKAWGERHLPAEGVKLGWWVLLDFGDVVVHLMQPEAREHYDLERLYGDCVRLEWPKIAPPAGLGYPVRTRAAGA